jgi:hypothetical protein
MKSGPKPKSKPNRWAELDQIVEHWQEFGRDAPDNPKVLVAVNATGREDIFEIGIIHRSTVPRKRGGAPKKWGETEQLCIWLAVEIEVQLAKNTIPGIGYKAAMQKFFRRGQVLYINASCDPLIKTANIALKNHREGAALLRRSPNRAARWENIRKIEIARRSSAA